MTQPLTPETGFQRLQSQSAEFAELFTHGSLVVEYYKPDRIDNQQPHTRDEVYVITSGTGIFDLAGTTMAVKPGDLLFVPAILRLGCCFTAPMAERTRSLVSYFLDTAL